MPRCRRQVPAKPSLGHEHRCGGVVQHHGEPFLGIARVQRNIRTARLENAQQADDHGEPPLQTEADEHVGPHPKRPQVMGQSVGPVVEFPIGQRFPIVDHGHRIRVPLHLLLEEFVDARAGPLHSQFGRWHRGRCGRVDVCDAHREASPPKQPRTPRNPMARSGMSAPLRG